MRRFNIYSQEYRNYYNQFMRYLQGVGYSKSSCKTFATGICEFLQWTEKQSLFIDQLKETHLETFYNHIQERPSTTTGGALTEGRITLHMYTLKLFFQHLQDTEQILVNPMANLHYTSDYKRTRKNLLTIEDIQTLYDQCDTIKQRAIIGMVYGCGLRRQEAVKLNAKDIHFRSSMLYVREGKGGRKRIIPLSKSVAEDFREYYYNYRTKEVNRNNADSLEAFMIHKYGNRMQADTYSEEMKRLTIKAGLSEEICLHHFRHAIATHLLEGGMKTEHVKDFLGHMSIETTQTYTHITAKEMKKTTAYGTAKVPG
jgi:integrase/recombinase XerD